MDRSEPTVFVVDDDEAVCESLRLLIEGAGFRVETFCSAEEFLEAYEPGVPGCLVVDVRMPGMNGLELSAELTKRRANLSTIVITGHGDVPIAVQAVKTGAINFLEKPFDDEVLLEDIRRAIAADAGARRASDE